MTCKPKLFPLFVHNQNLLEFCKELLWIPKGFVRRTLCKTKFDRIQRRNLIFCASSGKYPKIELLDTGFSLRIPLFFVLKKHQKFLKIVSRSFNTRRRSLKLSHSNLLKRVVPYAKKN